MKRVLTLAALVAICAVPLLAQRMGGNPPMAGMPGMQGLPGMGSPMAMGQNRGALAGYLQLTDDQKAAWEAAGKEFFAALQPLRTRQRELRAQLQTAMQGNDAAAIGNVMLQMRANGDQMKAAGTALDKKLVSVLTPEQKAKYDVLKGFREYMRERR